VTQRPEGTHVSKKESFDDRTWDSEEKGTRLVVRIRMKRIQGRRLTGPVGVREGRALGSREALEPHAQRVLTVCQALRLGTRLRVRRHVVFVGPAHSLRGRRRGTLSLSLRGRRTR
jgi:hypothetical protein